MALDGGWHLLVILMSGYSNLGEHSLLLGGRVVGRITEESVDNEKEQRKTVGQSRTRKE